MNLYKNITKAIAKLASLVCILAIVGLVGMILAELIYRNIFEGSFRASIEICGILFLWMAFMGIIPLYHDNGLMRLDFLAARVKGVTYNVLYFINKLFSLLLGVIMVVAFYAQYPFVSTRFYATMMTVPYTVQYVPMAIAGAYIALKTVEQIIDWALNLGRKTQTAE